MSRRSFLQSAALTGAAITGAALSLPCLLKPPAADARIRPALNPYDAEAARLDAALMSHFWSPTASIFKAPVQSADTVNSDATYNNGYLFWPSLVAWHALVEGERSHPGVYAAQIWEVYSRGLQQYWNQSMGAYNAWLFFPGNNDAYYDDNAWAVVTLVEAHSATVASDPTHAAAYLSRAVTLMQGFVYAGWDDTGHPGGVRWGTDPTKANTSDKATSSTAAAALAALMLARAGVNAKFNTAWGASALQWIMTNLRGPNGLIQDGLVPPTAAQPGWTPRPVYWTYNTGVPIRAFVEHYRLTRSASSLGRATGLARAAIDHGNRPLFDGSVQNPSVNHWYDYGYFAQYLIDGLLQLALVTPDPSLAASLRSEATGNARFLLSYVKDGDGLYWRNLRLYRIGPTQLQAWESLTGQAQVLDADLNERALDPASAKMPIAQRPLVKTLLANAAAARLFWLMSRA